MKAAMFDPRGSTILLGFLMAVAASSFGQAFPGDGQVVKQSITSVQASKNLLRSDGWYGWKNGFQLTDGVFLCDNGSDTEAQRGVGQTALLNQQQPAPIIAEAWSKAENVSGSPDSNYSLYLDILYQDGSHLWGQNAPFSTGTHDWEKRRVVVVPDKPVRSVAFYMLLRSHSGAAWFREPKLYVLDVPEKGALFDGVPVLLSAAPIEGFQLRDVAGDGSFVAISRQALGVVLRYKRTERQGAVFYDVELTDTTGRDRALTLVYSVPVPAAGTVWLHDPRRSEEVRPGREYINAGHFRVGANGRLSRYPFAAVAHGDNGVALGIDMSVPAFFRVAYNASAGELFLAYDVALVPEKPSAKLRFCRFGFDPQWGFRSALTRYYEIFPEAFVRRVEKQGLWMPFARISQVEGWEDFGFRFKEGTNEIPWDDRHGIITFRYTEPMTWWMPMKPELPRTMEAALAEAMRLAGEGHPWARALLTSGFHDRAGKFVALLRDTPWCNGAVWSMNSMPGIKGEFTDFKNKWNSQIKARYYGTNRRGDLDGEYIDSSEGYVTAELDFRQDHFAAAETPLCFALEDRRPGIFRGLIVFEYVRAIAEDVHSMGKLTMANGTPARLCWLAPMLDVMGTETDWHRSGKWQPMSDGELLYRRALCKGKPFCFLMNTNFDEFPPELVERYMQRSLAYGMFPGFFSPNASTGHYFTRPELYNRDRPLFKKYVRLCRLVAEAGWEPITLARTDHPKVYVERFGKRYLTVFNDDSKPHSVTVTTTLATAAVVRELVRNQVLECRKGVIRLKLGAEEVAVLDLLPRSAR